MGVNPFSNFPSASGYRLQVEAMLLGHAFDRLALHFPSWDYRQMLSFNRSSFADPTSRPLLHPEFPNLQDIFGDQAPTDPKTYSTTCHLQRTTFPSVLTQVAPCPPHFLWTILKSRR